MLSYCSTVLVLCVSEISLLYSMLCLHRPFFQFLFVSTVDGTVDVRHQPVLVAKSFDILCTVLDKKCRPVRVIRSPCPSEWWSVYGGSGQTLPA